MWNSIFLICDDIDQHSKSHILVDVPFCVLGSWVIACPSREKIQKRIFGKWFIKSVFTGSLSNREPYTTSHVLPAELQRGEKKHHSIAWVRIFLTFSLTLTQTRKKGWDTQGPNPTLKIPFALSLASGRSPEKWPGAHHTGLTSVLTSPLQISSCPYGITLDNRGNRPPYSEPSSTPGWGFGSTWHLVNKRTLRCAFLPSIKYSARSPFYCGHILLAHSDPVEVKEVKPITIVVPFIHSSSCWDLSQRRTEAGIQLTAAQCYSRLISKTKGCCQHSDNLDTNECILKKKSCCLN